MMEDQEFVQEFLIESNENLARLDREMVELERRPDDHELLASVFRTVHTIKGTCGFLGFSRLEALAHVTEDLLSDLRNGRRQLDTPLTSIILESVDAIKRILRSIEAGSDEGEPFESELIPRLKQARDGAPAPPPAAAPATAPAEPQPAGEPVALAKGPVADANLRVDVGLLDRLMNLVGELVLTRNQLVQYNAARDDSSLNAISQRLNLITTELQEGVMKTRMQPIGLVWNKLPRVVRDLSTALGKEIDLEMDGSDTELDRTILEAIKDPLTHLVRNSCDHGIETPAERLARGKPGKGRLVLRAFHKGGHVNIEIADDGAGIDPGRVKAKAVERNLLSAGQAQRLSEAEAVNLVFLPGFSTAPVVTNISGRGVGMDVVRTHIERIGGTVVLSSQTGRGTTVNVKIPLTLAIIPGLVVSAGGERFVIPQMNLHELIRVEGENVQSRIEYIHATPVFRRREALLPLTDLSHILRLPPDRRPDEISIVVLQVDQHRFGLIVDSISDSQEIVVKPLALQFKGLNCYAGATIMGDGRIALILDVPGIGQMSGMLAGAGQHARATASAPPGSPSGEQPKSLLLFRAGDFGRLAMPLSQVARLEKIAASSVERAAGRPVVQYRGRILPLLSVAEFLGCGSAAQEELLNVVIYRNGSSEIGLVVDEIIDVVEEAVMTRHGCGGNGLLASAVVAGKITDFLDLQAVAGSASPTDPESLHRLEAALAGDRALPEEVPA
jgi:two-component system chemotaxis sensor kinase CheA